MTRKTRFVRDIVLASSLVAALAACNKPAPVPTPEAVAPAAAPAASIKPTDMTPKPTDPMMAFDIKGFAGNFHGTLPCADCPGVDETLMLGADGAFALKDSYRERGTTAELAGTWTAEADGKRLRLDPDSKSDQDRVFAINDDGSLSLLDAQGQPLPGNPPPGLTRQ